MDDQDRNSEPGPRADRVGPRFGDRPRLPQGRKSGPVAGTSERTAPAALPCAEAESPPYQTFPVADGEIVIAVGNDPQFQRFCRDVIGRPDLAEDARFKTNIGRIKDRAALIAEIAAEFIKHPRAAWLEKMDEAGIPAGQVRELPEVLNSPEVAARGMVQEVAMPDGTRVRFSGSPLNFSETPVRSATAPPTLGQHTDQVLSELLSLSADEITRLRDAGAIG